MFDKLQFATLFWDFLLSKTDNLQKQFYQIEQNAFII